MKRKKDITAVECKLCKKVFKASGMPSHLFRKHSKMSSKEYVAQFGEFRQKHLNRQTRIKTSNIKCEICDKEVVSHKALLHHLHIHNITWQEYFIKYFFNNIHPVCSCGCGEKVKLIRHGQNEKKETAYARKMLPGHHKHQPGYRHNTPEQKSKMRLSAIKRMEESSGTYFNNGPSRGEKELTEYLQKITRVVTEDRKVLSGREIDILLPEYNIGIEYNGGYFHSDLFKDRKYHLSKTLEAKSNGVRLLHIWEHDWVHSREKVEDLLNSILHQNRINVYARKTTVSKIKATDARLFLDKYHLQGSCVGKVWIGLYYEKELISVMGFSSLRKATGLTKKEGSYELIRLCNKHGVNIPGGPSKLFTFFKRNYNPDYTLSYANRDWSEGKVYSTLGFEESIPTPPGYFYVKSKFKFSRFQFQKHKLIEQGFDPLKSEYEIMLSRGYHRVWDTGNLKFECYHGKRT